jgi:hypothetical protein
MSPYPVFIGILLLLVLVMLNSGSSALAIILLGPVLYLTVWTTRLWLRQDFDLFHRRHQLSTEPLGTAITITYWLDFPTREDAEAFCRGREEAEYLGPERERHNCKVPVRTKVDIFSLKYTRFKLWLSYGRLNGRIYGLG